jgi:hypothetical protein
METADTTLLGGGIHLVWKTEGKAAKIINDDIRLLFHAILLLIFYGTGRWPNGRTGTMT